MQTAKHTVFNYFLGFLIASSLAFLLTFNLSVANSAESVSSNVSNNALSETEKRRELMEKAIHEEKIKMVTQSRDLANERRAAGEILGFDLFLGAFLSALWILISLFLFTRFDSSRVEDAKRSGLSIFILSASLMPFMLIWVALSTGYLSWWLTFALSVLINGLFYAIFSRMRKQ
jgi:hypothetical protein